MSFALRPWFSLVKFGHSVFALPFALSSAWLAAQGMPAPRVLLLVVLCAVSARTAAMAFNRWLDRRIDAANPRTAGRELPRGALTPGAVLALTCCSALTFCAGAWALNPLCAKLAPAVLSVLLAYSAFKRFSSAAHFVLGLALALAPLGAWVAVRGELSGDLSVPLLLALAVLSWVAGFDLIYACQDEAFDRAHGLHSIPARFGVARALQLSSALHVITLLALLACAARAELGWVFGVALAAAGLLLVWQHRLVSPTDLSRADVAFFTLNGWVSVALFLGTALDLGLH
ncbi:MAG: 4-hydroxybenzoate octaprenyltransferase [Planctomycetes bacterium]|nr:4-hydroxybenzoate octaprenyltransferase [Planctomycetota bacterium]